MAHSRLTDMHSKEGSFDLQKLPKELIVQVISLLDFPELRYISLTCADLRLLIGKDYGYILSLRNERIRVWLDMWFERLRPSYTEFCHHRMMDRNWDFNPIHREIIYALGKEFRKQRLSKLLALRPSLEDVERMGILRGCDHLGNKIQSLERTALPKTLIVVARLSKRRRSCSYILRNILFYETLSHKPDLCKEPCKEPCKRRTLNAKVEGSSIKFF